MKKRYNDLNSYLRNLFGCRVQKITVDAGLICPNRDGSLSKGGCIYCNTRGSGTGAHARGLSITRQLINGKESLSKRYKAKKFLAYFQSFSNTYAPLPTLQCLYDEALSIDDVVGLSIGTRPDCVNEPVLNLLQTYAERYLVWVEYGLQSANDATLDFINRGHDVQCFVDTVEKTKAREAAHKNHVSRAVPYVSLSEDATTLARLGIDGVKLHLLYVVKGTRLEALYQKGEFKCLEQQAYVDLVCDFLERIPFEMVVQRLTGDPHRKELVAPAWSLKKTETLERVRKTLEKRDSWQGKYFEK